MGVGEGNREGVRFQPAPTLGDLYYAYVPLALAFFSTHLIGE